MKNVKLLASALVLAMLSSSVFAVEVASEKCFVEDVNPLLKVKGKAQEENGKAYLMLKAEECDKLSGVTSEEELKKMGMSDKVEMKKEDNKK